MLSACLLSILTSLATSSEPQDCNSQLPALRTQVRHYKHKNPLRHALAVAIPSAIAAATVATALIASAAGAYTHTRTKFYQHIATWVDRSGEKFSCENTTIDKASWRNIFNYINANRSITHLHFDGVNLRNGMPSLLSCLRTNNALKQLNLTLTWLNTHDACQLFATLKNNNALTSLTISYGFLDGEALTSVIECLQSNTTLKKLVLIYGSFSAKQISVFLSSLFQQDSLQTLILSNSLAYNAALTAQQATTIGTSLQPTKTLTSLSLHNVFKQGENSLPLIRALHGNASLKKLDLSNNHLHNEEIPELVLALKANSTLRTLFLDSNNLDTNGVRMLLDGLKTQKTLKVLSVKMFHRDPAASSGIASYLQTNPTLEELSLRPDDVAGSFEALENNTTLRFFDLNSAGISLFAMQKLASALSKNSTLTQLDLRNSSLEGDNSALILLENGLKTNFSLHYCDLDSCCVDFSSYTTVDGSLKRNRDRLLATAFFASLYDKIRIIDTNLPHGKPNALAQDLIKLGRSREITEHIMSFLVGNRRFTQESELAKKVYKSRLLYPTTRLLKELDADKPTAKKQAFWLVRSCKIWNKAERLALGEAD
jgi:Ran GTPase-activating protein (RanGAP) involved in mRNA processing and transport